MVKKTIIDKAVLLSGEDIAAEALVAHKKDKELSDAERAARKERADRFAAKVSDLITHRECEMLIRNLMDLKYPPQEVKDIAVNYGYDPYAGTWNDTKFEEYKAGMLYERMTDPKRNYTFILLKDDKGETAAIASFNAPEDKSQLRVLNFTVAPEHRMDFSLMRALARHVMEFALDHGFTKITGPLSKYAVNEKNHLGYQNLAKRYHVECKVEPAGEGAEMTFVSRSLDKQHKPDPERQTRLSRWKERAASRSDGEISH